MSRKFGGCAPFFLEGEEVVPHLTQYVTWAEAYLRTKWLLDSSNRLATIDIGRKLGAVLLLGRAVGSPILPI